jgi:eukaryotic-like serine/threonine-protein kinase
MTKIVGDSGVSITRYICGRCGSRWATAEPCPLCKVAVQALSAGEAGDDPLVGTSLANRYQIMARIGRGSIGAIFRAIDQTTERQVAVKVLKKHLVRDEELRARFDQEAQALKRMQHKNLIAVRDCGITTSGEEPFIVMEYVDGETLASVLGDLTYIPAERLVPVMVQVCDALIHAHSQGILHRDIKPANIMLLDLPRERDVVKVLDFGLAKIADDAFASSSNASFETNPGDPIGTPLYMSPEQARGEKLDARTDIYSIGAVLYECLTGVPPISGTGVIEILKKQVSYTPPAMNSVRPFLQIPSELEAIVSKCMQKERSERYNNMFELKEALLAVQASLTPATPAEGKKGYVSSSHMQAVTAGQTKAPSLWDKVMNALKGKK